MIYVCNRDCDVLERHSWRLPVDLVAVAHLEGQTSRTLVSVLQRKIKNKTRNSLRLNGKLWLASCCAALGDNTSQTFVSKKNYCLL